MGFKIAFVTHIDDYVLNVALPSVTKALEGPRCPQNATGTGVVGSDRLYDRLTGGSRSADFSQSFAQIGKRVRLPGAAALVLEVKGGFCSAVRDMLGAVVRVRSAAARRTAIEQRSRSILKSLQRPLSLTTSRISR